VGGGYFFRLQTSCGAHGSFSLETGSYFSVVKRQDVKSVVTYLMPKLVMSGTVPPLLIGCMFLTWFLIKHKESFIFPKIRNSRLSLN
jgi:hypothetical protein